MGASELYMRVCVCVVSVYQPTCSDFETVLLGDSSLLVCAYDLLQAFAADVWSPMPEWEKVYRALVYGCCT